MTIKTILCIALAASVCGAALPVSAHAAGHPLIVGGADAPPGAWPSIAYVQGAYNDAAGHRNAFACTGTIVAARWVVTAAHCTRGEDGERPTALSATVGMTDLTAPGDKIAVDGFVRYPHYDPDQGTGDIALLHLARPTAQPAMGLAAAGEATTSPPSVPNAAGWGATDEDGTSFTPALQQAYLEIQPAAACSAQVGAGFDPSTQTCAGTPGMTGACFGDSGGPLIEFDATTGAPVLWGITSYGPDNAGPPCSLAVPTVYTSAPAFAGFVAATLAEPEPAAVTALRRPAARRAPHVRRKHRAHRRHRARRRAR